MELVNIMDDSSQKLEVIAPNILLSAYTQGIFPMADEGEILWFSPEQRGIIPLDERFKVNHGLKRALRKKPFEVHFNRDFEGVMRGCAEREETWIDEVIIKSYVKLHKMGYAWSVECWDEDGLQGGLYGVHYRKAFFGESMFSRKSNASKIALVHLVEKLREEEFMLLDTQWLTTHLETFGGYGLEREKYLKILSEAVS